MAKTRMSLELNEDLTSFIDRLADREGATRVEIIRRALSVMKAYEKAYLKGRTHIGFTSDPDKLDTEIVGVLTTEPQPI